MRDFSKELIVKTSVSMVEKGKNIFIPEDATNGDVIKAVFPNCLPREGTLLIDTDIAVFEPDWWNAPYKENINAL